LSIKLTPTKQTYNNFKKVIIFIYKRKRTIKLYIKNPNVFTDNTIKTIKRMHK